MDDPRRISLKTMLLCMCRVQLLVGLIVGLSGGYLMIKFRQNSLFFSASSYMTLPVLFTIATAVFLLVIGVLGSWMIAKNSVFLQGVFVYLLVMIFCLGSTSSALAYHHSFKLDSELTPLRGVFEVYTGGSQDQYSQAVDTLQESMQCCGVHNYRDWWQNSWFNQTGRRRLPQSCCNRIFTSCTGSISLPEQFYQVGCHEKLQIVFWFLLRKVMWMFSVVFLMLVILFVIIVKLMKDQQPLHHFPILDKTKAEKSPDCGAVLY